MDAEHSNVTTSPFSGPPSTEETQRLLRERYGLRGPRRWGVVAVAAVVAVAGLSWLTWAAWSASDRDIEAELVAWQVVSPHAVEVELVVHRDHGDEVRCTVSAQASDAVVVGEAEAPLPAGEAGEYRVEVTVPTEREATAVRLMGCE
jgi:Domain of unknown function (DUF4307)